MGKRPWEYYNLPPPKSEASKGPLSLVDWEIFSGLEVPTLPFWVRLDGWGFHTLAEKLQKPYDKNFAKILVGIAKDLMQMFNAQLAYIFSDEINLLFTHFTAFRRVEKIDSVFAGIASARFSLTWKTPCAFDCRVIPVPKGKILSYLQWRQAECFRNHNNAWAYWLLRQAGLSARQAADFLEGLKTQHLVKLCRACGKDLSKTQTWQRQGIMLYWKKYKKSGWNPIKKKRVVAQRRRVVIEWNPPNFTKNRWLIKELLSDI
ncbi:MAG: tRNA(His) guanylyltransferase Thg1 family protein [Candidatus Aenigmatarchaeota archaeon]